MCPRGAKPGWAPNGGRCGLRIVSLSPSITEIIVKLGAGDELVGVSIFCRPYAPPHAEPVGDYLNIKMDRLAELRPDLVFTSGRVQERLAERLRAAGYRVAHLPIPESLWGVPGLVWSVAVRIGRAREAIELSAVMAEKLAGLRGAAPPARVLYVIDLGEPIAPGALSYAGHALSHLGLAHLYEAVPVDWVRVAPLDVRRYHPQVIVYEAKIEEPRPEHALGALRRWMLLDERLERRARIVTMPRDTLAHYGPSLVDNLARLAERLSG